MSQTLIQTLLIALMGMGATFVALALILASMVVLTRLVQDPTGESPAQVIDQAVPLRPADIVLPAGTPLQHVAAAAVAVAAAQELARQRRSAQVWASQEPRSLISPWQLVARGRELERKIK
jgi:hypothetical protein